MRPPRVGGVRADGAAALALVPARTPRPPAPAPVAPAFVALDRLRLALEAVDWAPLRLATGRAARPASPRLPHALALHLAHAARAADVGAVDAEPAVGVIPNRPRLAALLAAEVAQVDAALDALVRAGVVGRAEDDGDAGQVQLAAGVLGRAPRCGALDWAGVAAATAGSPTAWVAAHALAERLERHHWTPVPRADLEAVLGSGASGARGALDRLVAAGVVERREQRGGVSVYRFAEASWGGTGQASVVPSSAALAPAMPSPAVQMPPAPAPAAQTPAASAPERGPGLRLVLGGVEIEVPAGLRARVELGADGRPTLTLLPGA